MVPIGITLQPARRYLDILAPLFETEAEFFEVAPETLWRLDESGEFVPNAYHLEFAELAARTGKPTVAHGVGLSLGTVDPADAPRLRRWLRRIELDHQVFDFQWYTDHLGVTVLAGHTIGLPIALPMTQAMASTVRTRLAALQSVVPDVGFENSVFYFLLGGWLDEPAFFDAILELPRCHLLLDLHNVYTMGLNFDVDPVEYLDRIDLDQVLEIHLSGGTRSDPAWLPDGRTMRLDSHDAAIPEAVWRLYERVARRCDNLRGVCVERMEGTVEEPDLPVLRDELRRAKEVLRGRP